MRNTSKPLKINQIYLSERLFSFSFHVQQTEIIKEFLIFRENLHSQNIKLASITSTVTTNPNPPTSISRANIMKLQLGAKKCIKRLFNMSMSMVWLFVNISKDWLDLVEF